jgi:hypothetical protein
MSCASTIFEMVLLVLLWALLSPEMPCETLDLGHPRAELARIFTPLTAPPGAYTVTTINRAIADLAAALKGCDAAPAEGAWQLTRMEAHEAFGQAGIYDRLRLAQLFGGTRVDVVRGSLAHDGLRDGYTLISPYPDASLTAVNPGTLVIVLHVARGAASTGPTP